MLGSSIIDIAIGLIFIYLLLSLICSAGNEIIERWSKKRSKDLERGVQEMLRDPNLVESLYKHPLIYSLFSKPYQPGGSNLPSYIPSRNFALALMDIVAPPDEQGIRVRRVHKCRLSGYWGRGAKAGCGGDAAASRRFDS